MVSTDNILRVRKSGRLLSQEAGELMRMNIPKNGSTISTLTAFFILLVMPLFFAASESAALDNPHISSNTVNCATCHIANPPASWWTDQGQATGLCGQCHNAAAIGTDVTTHVSTKYGNVILQCTDCHNPHYQRQFRVFKDPSYLYKGRISAVTSTTMTQDLTYTGARSWSETPTPEWAGMLLVPDVRYPGYSYRILSNTDTMITIDRGTTNSDEINSIIQPGATFAIVYGKLVKESVWGKVVRFFRKSGTNSFADGDATIDGICQVCHTRTVAFNRSGTLEDPTNLHPKNVTGTDCKSCHTHTNSFKASCNACHGNPPVNGSTLVFNPGTTGSATAGAHNAHVTTQGIGCAACHVNSVGSGPKHNDGAPQTVTIGFSLFGGARLGGSYDGQTTVGYDSSELNTSVTSPGSGAITCSTIYCHSTVQGTGGTGAPTYATPSWNNTPPNNVQCGSCHKADGTGDGSKMDSASHTKHVATANYNMPCSNCHSGSGSGTSTHVDNTIQVSFATNYGGSYNGSDTTPGNHAPGQGYGTCSTNYCHSTGTASPTYKTPVWGDVTTGQCGTCHGADATTPPSSSSHAKHVGGGSVYKYSCKKCHSTTVDDTAADSTTKPGIVDKTVHVMNKTRDVNLNTSDPLVGSLATNSGTTCTNIYCHSTGKAADVPATQLPTAYNGKHYSTVTWGDALTCASCHGKAQSGYPDYTMANQVTDQGTARANSHQSGTHRATNCAVCHIETTADGTSIASNRHVNAAINVKFDGAHDLGGAVYNPDRSCSNVSCHGASSPVWGGAGDCTTCHEAGAVNISSVHNKHWDTAAGNATARTTGNASTATYYQFQCNTCHTGGTHPTGATGANFADLGFNITWVGASYQTNGTYIANNNANDTTDSRGQRISTDGQCNSIYCHSSGIAPGAAGPTYANIAWNTAPVTPNCGVCHGAPPATNAHAKHATTYSMGCTECHQATASSNTAIGDKSKHVNYVNEVAWQTSGKNIGGSDYETAGADTCSNIYCHSQGRVNAAPYTTGVNAGNAPNSNAVWTGGSLSAECTGCHNGDSAVTGGTLVMSSGKHGKHISNSSVIGKDITCDKCHSATAAADQNRTIGTPANHANKEVNVAFTSLNSGASYSGSVTPGDSFGTCSTSYCHSIGNTSVPSGQLPGGAPSIYTTPGWGDAAWTTVCNGCHGRTTTSGSPDYTSGSAGSASANSHPKHAATYSIGCSECHWNTTQDNTNIVSASTTHISGSAGSDVVPKPAVSGGKSPSMTYTSGVGNKTCSTAYCHSDGKATAATVASVQWGATTITCASCHGGANGSSGGAGTTLSGNHTVHTNATYSYGCADCHSTVATDNSTINDKSLHVNAQRTVSVATARGGDGNDYDSGTGKCSTTNCHGTTSPAWGTTTTVEACTKCHGSPTAPASYVLYKAAPGADGPATGVGGGKDTAGDTGTYSSNVSNDPQVGAHNAHLQSLSNFSSDVACSECHAVPANPNIAGHFGASPADLSWGTLADPDGPGVGLDPAYDPGTGQCSNVYCHGRSLADGLSTAPKWSTQPLYIDGTAKTQANCEKCHGAPPASKAIHNLMTIANDCSGCHGHNGSDAAHINGVLVASGNCDSCHGYQSASWATATERAVEGKGAHAKHVAHLVALWGGTLNPTGDGFGSGASWTNVCGKCHNGATHNMSEAIGGNGRQISIEAAYQFGSFAPSYTGVPATSSSVNPKSCSNISCHFQTTPVWSTY